MQWWQRVLKESARQLSRVAFVLRTHPHTIHLCLVVAVVLILSL